MAGSGRSSDISSSSVVANTVGAHIWVGGLVGYTWRTDISSSSVVAGTINGTRRVGGLAGYGSNFKILSSSVIAGTIVGRVNLGGNINVGGLVGYGTSGRISSSFAVAENIGVEPNDYGAHVGGLVGGAQGRSSIYIYNSLVLGGSIRGHNWVGRIAGENSGSITDTYWLDNIRFIGTGYFAILLAKVKVHPTYKPPLTLRARAISMQIGLMLGAILTLANLRLTPPMIGNQCQSGLGLGYR